MPPDEKIGRGVAFALEGELRAIIERRLQTRRLDCPLIFHCRGRAIGNFGHAWAVACRAAGLAKVEERNGRTYYHPLRRKPLAGRRRSRR